MNHKSIDELKEYIEKTISVDDAILALFFASKQEYIIKKPALLYKIFQEISQESKIILLNDLIFDVSGPTPFCDELDQSFMRLEMSELLPYIRKGNESWYFLNDSKKYQEKSYSKFNAEEQIDLANSAKKLIFLPKFK